MLVAANAGDGQATASSDVCQTPNGSGVDTPVPYTNTANNAQATNTSQTVKICMQPALHLGTTIPSSSGDEEGTDSPNQGKSSYTTGDPNVSIEGYAAIALSHPTTQNGSNAVGSVTVPSSTNVYYNHLAAGPAPGGDRWARAMSAADLDALHEAMHGGRPPRCAVLEGDVGHVAVDLFTPALPSEIHAAVRRLTIAGARAIVLDLRGNPGGDLDAALRLAGDFLPEGAVLARVTDADGDETVHVSRSARPQTCPLVVLVDRATASAAEVFAGGLKAHDRAVVVGERTRGKGAVQAVVPAADGAGVVCATVAHCALPDGEPVEGAGVEPDVCITRGPGDPQLDAAWALALAMGS